MNNKYVKKFIEPHFHKDLNLEDYEIETVESIDLLTHTRFDLAFKLLYLDMKNENVKFSDNLYKTHIKAFSLGNYTEPGNKDKNSIEKYIAEFETIFKDIEKNGFDNNKSLLPLSTNGAIANGAHRVACAIYLNKQVECAHIKTGDHIYDYKFFYGRNVSRGALDAAATTFVEYANNLHIAFVWPSAEANDKQVEQIIPNIVYQKHIQLNPNGAHNLLSQIYFGEDWLGNVENDFNGVNGKFVECFKSFGPIRVIAFQANGLEEVLEIKDKIRAVFNVGKHSIHITDTKKEAVRAARLVFNDNSIHFLNHAKPNKYLSTHNKMIFFKKFIEKNNIDQNKVVLDCGIILSAYGVRECSDTDYFIANNEKLDFQPDGLEIHDEELKYHTKSKLEMIFNPEYYFYFNDLKFVSFPLLYSMKKNRAEQKDINDCNMMDGLIENNSFKKNVAATKQYINYKRIKAKRSGLIFLKKYQLYETIRYIYRKIRGKK